MQRADPLDQQVAVITGANGALGTATARILAERGASILAVDRPGTDWSLFLAAMPERAQVATADADVTDEGAVAGYVEDAVRRFGTIDIFFNNAGIEGPGSRIEEYSLDAFRHVIDVNVTGVFLGLKHVLPVMYARGRGSVINTSSVAGLVGTPGMVAYNTSKHAVVGMTRVAAVEAGRRGVRVNSVNPGPIESRMMAAIDDSRPDAAASRKAVTALVPLGRYGTPDEVARLVAFLASDEASFCNGGVYSVDGGRHAV